MNLEAVRGQTQQAPQLRPMPPLQPPLVPLLQVSPPPLRPSPSSSSSSPPPSSSSSSSPSSVVAVDVASIFVDASLILVICFR